MYDLHHLSYHSEAARPAPQGCSTATRRASAARSPPAPAAPGAAAEESRIPSKIPRNHAKIAGKSMKTMQKRVENGRKRRIPPRNRAEIEAESRCRRGTVARARRLDVAIALLHGAYIASSRRSAGIPLFFVCFEAFPPSSESKSSQNRAPKLLQKHPTWNPGVVGRLQPRARTSCSSQRHAKPRSTAPSVPRRHGKP